MEIDEREGFRALLVDDSSGLIVLKDYKENKIPLERGDFIKAYGGMRKPSELICF